MRYTNPATTRKHLSRSLGAVETALRLAARAPEAMLARLRAEESAVRLFFYSAPGSKLFITKQKLIPYHFGGIEEHAWAILGIGQSMYNSCFTELK